MVVKGNIAQQSLLHILAAVESMGLLKLTPFHVQSPVVWDWTPELAATQIQGNVGGTVTFRQNGEMTTDKHAEGSTPEDDGYSLCSQSMDPAYDTTPID